MRIAFDRVCSRCGGDCLLVLDVEAPGSINAAAELGACNYAVCPDCWAKGDHRQDGLPFYGYNERMYPLVYDTVVQVAIMSTVSEDVVPALSRRVLESNIGHIRLFSPN